MQLPRHPDQDRSAVTELRLLALTLIALLAWEAAGLDLTVARLLGDATGFALRDAWLTRTVLHDAARWISAACVAALACDLLRSPEAGPSRMRRAYWFAVILLTLALIPLLKRITATSCPWDLVEFGGVAAYVPHWRLDVGDGGPGHCFPAGHPVSAFAFVGLYYLWRDSRPRRARWLLILALSAGGLLSGAQIARGAHFTSHALWSAWLAGVGAVAGRYFEPRWRRVGPAPQTDAKRWMAS